MSETDQLRAARPARGAELELSVDSLAHGGSGVARHDGFVVFVQGGMPGDRVTFALSRFEEFAFPADCYDLVNAEFSLPFIKRGDFAPTFTALLRSVRQGGIFSGQLFGPNDSWSVENSGMSFHTRAEVEAFFRDFEFAHFEEEDHPGTTKLGEPKHWHIFHIIAKKPAGEAR